MNASIECWFLGLPQNCQFQRREIDLCCYHCPNYFSILVPAENVLTNQFEIQRFSLRFPIQGSHVQKHWVAPRLTQSFILLRLIKSIPEISGNLLVKKCLLEVALVLRQLNPIRKKDHNVFLKNIFFNLCIFLRQVKLQCYIG